MRTRAIRRRNRAFYEEIARQHRAHVAAGWPPIRAIALANGVHEKTASNWITAARALGCDVPRCSGMRHHYMHGTPQDYADRIK
jgi:hypothetical protein